MGSKQLKRFGAGRCWRRPDSGWRVWSDVWRCQGRDPDAGLFTDSAGVRRLLRCEVPVEHFRAYADAARAAHEVKARRLEEQGLIPIGIVDALAKVCSDADQARRMEQYASVKVRPDYFGRIFIHDDYNETVADAGPDPFVLPKDPKGRFFGDDPFPYPDDD